MFLWHTCTHVTCLQGKVGEAFEGVISSKNLSARTVECKQTPEYCALHALGVRMRQRWLPGLFIDHETAEGVQIDEQKLLLGTEPEPATTFGNKVSTFIVRPCTEGLHLGGQKWRETEIERAIACMVQKKGVGVTPGARTGGEKRIGGAASSHA